MKEKSTQVFMGIKYQKKVLSVFAYQLYSIDSVFKTSKNYHFQVFFEEFKYVVKEKKTAKYITDSLWSTLFNKRNHVYVDILVFLIILSLLNNRLIRHKNHY